MIHTKVKNLPISKERLQELKMFTETDSELQTVMKMIKEGWPPHKKLVPPTIRCFWDIRNDLHEAEGIIMKSQKLVIPFNMRQHILELLHKAHLGIEKTKARARATVYWPGISGDIETYIRKCKECQQYTYKNPKERFIAHPIPDTPWTKIGSDIFEHSGKLFIVAIDYFSKFIEFSEIRDKTVETVILFFKQIFARHGILVEIIADNVPYNSKKYNSKLTNSSPRYTQSNGMSELAVRIMKRILKKYNDPYISLLEYLNTPLTGMTYSPCQLLMSRPTRTLLPTTKDFLTPELAKDGIIQTDQNKEKQKEYYNRNAKTLPEIQSNTSVRFLKDKKWEPGILLNKTEHPRSYLIDTPNGIIRRNRRHSNVTNEDFSIKQNTDDEIIELKNDNNNEIITERSTTSNESNKQLLEPTINTESNPGIEQNEANITLRRSNRVRNRPKYLKDYT